MVAHKPSRDLQLYVDGRLRPGARLRSILAKLKAREQKIDNFLYWFDMYTITNRDEDKVELMSAREDLKDPMCFGHVECQVRVQLRASQSQDEAEIDCEVAREIISQYFAMTSIAMAGARTKKIAAVLETRLRQLHREKMALAPSNQKLIAKILQEYGPIVSIPSRVGNSHDDS